MNKETKFKVTGSYVVIKPVSKQVDHYIGRIEYISEYRKGMFDDALFVSYFEDDLKILTYQEVEYHVVKYYDIIGIEIPIDSKRDLAGGSAFSFEGIFKKEYFEL